MELPTRITVCLGTRCRTSIRVSAFRSAATKRCSTWDAAAARSCSRRNVRGRGFFLEWQGGQLFMAGYMYDAAGNPIWYLSGNSVASTNLQSYSNQWLQFGSGQTLTGTYRAPVQVNGNVAPVTITFQGAENALMTLPGGRTTSIRRFRF